MVKRLAIRGIRINWEFKYSFGRTCTYLFCQIGIINNYFDEVLSPIMFIPSMAGHDLLYVGVREGCMIHTDQILIFDTILRTSPVMKNMKLINKVELMRISQAQFSLIHTDTDLTHRGGLTHMHASQLVTYSENVEVVVIVCFELILKKHHMTEINFLKNTIMYIKQTYRNTWNMHKAVKLPWIFRGASLTFNRAPGNIQGDLHRYQGWF